MSGHAILPIKGVKHSNRKLERLGIRQQGCDCTLSNIDSQSMCSFESIHKSFVCTKLGSIRSIRFNMALRSWRKSYIKHRIIYHINQNFYYFYLRFLFFSLVDNVSISMRKCTCTLNTRTIFCVGTYCVNCITFYVSIWKRKYVYFSFRNCSMFICSFQYVYFTSQSHTNPLWLRMFIIQSMAVWFIFEINYVLFMHL